jgi:hypothetical protein
MKIKRIKTLTRPSTDISWSWTTDNDTIMQSQVLTTSLIESEIISFTSVNLSEDGLTRTQEMHFDTVENYASFLKQSIDLDYTNGNLVNDFQHMANNNIVMTQTFTFE